ncbi:sulfotransferase family protein [Nocardioides sp.]|uniref:sulfotransferase family protein n=1 Tax=Nocardioides sp. TaxID=35761 RepID=UPI00271CC902|nr:sulfotransferase family protein [Nocardioides sp.]MDO9457066.1 sulfotransferase family protein [Nocardioides sp.]
MSRVVLVAGAGRSGTSTVAGALSMLGLHLPEPQVPADETNPRGFYESQWVVDFHKAILRRSPVVRTLDSRPEAAELARGLPTEVDADELDEWLGEALAQARQGQVVVKDPRAFWFHDLWRAAATQRGAGLGFVTMLRHPVEVAKSRDTHYTPTDRGESFRRQRATANIAGWVHACLVTEEVTRPDPRVFVRYVDLLAEWRPVLADVGARLDLDLDLETGAPLVDAFIEPTLRRSETTWDSVDVPDTLRAVAEGTWEQMLRLVDDPADPGVPTELARLRADYERVFDHAVGVALDHTQAREVHVRRRTRGNVREDFESKIAELEQQLEEAHLGTSDEDLDDRPRGFFGRFRG